MTGQSMDALLTELNDVPGVRGCGVTTPDGMIVRSSLEGRFREDVVSGLTSFLVSTTRRAFEEVGRDGEVRRFVVHATHGKLVIESVGDAFLAVITDQFARLEQLLETVGDVAQRMRELAQMAD